MRSYLLTLTLLYSVLTIAQTQQDGDRILAKNGSYKIPTKYENYSYLDFDRDREIALKEGRKGDVELLNKIETNRAYGVGKCSNIYKTAVGIIIGTVELVTIDNKEVFYNTNYLYTNWDVNYNNGTLTKIEKLNSHKIFDYSPITHDLLVLRINPSVVRERYLIDFYTFNLKTNEFKNQIKLNTSLYGGGTFSPNYDSIRIVVHEKEPKTPDNPLGVGSINVVKTFKVQNL